MEPANRGYFTTLVRDALAGTRYFYRVNGVTDLPDPASRLQPEGVDGPSEVVGDNLDGPHTTWEAPPVNKLVIRDIQVGGFTREGTFAAMIPKLQPLKASGVNAIELLPINEFAGRRNSPSDSLFPVAVHAGYGGPAGLSQLVRQCHDQGIAVAVEFNYAARELGNYLEQFGPYFSSENVTQWGKTLNFDGPGADDVRRLFVEGALYFVDQLHVDALRFINAQSFVDHSKRTFLEELAETLRSRGAQLLAPRMGLLQNERGAGGA